nr:unnamed protein product [Callosobruchus chinensis]
MDSSSYWDWKRPLKLHELMTEIENINNDDDEALIPDGIVVLPPVNATDYNTDEDSGVLIGQIKI